MLFFLVKYLKVITAKSAESVFWHNNCHLIVVKI